MRLMIADPGVVGAPPTIGLGLWNKDVKKLPATPNSESRIYADLADFVMLPILVIQEEKFGR